MFAAAPFDIETETASAVTAHARGRQLREQFADRTKRSGVGDWIGARCSSDRALIDHDRFVDLFDAAQRAISSRLFLRIIKPPKQCAPQNVVHQCRFAASGNAGYASETAKRKSHFDVL